MLRRFAALSLIAGCAASGTPAATPSGEEPASVPPPSSAPVTQSEALSSTTLSPPTAPSVSPEPPAGTGTLPEVRVKNVGLHVGGGPNDSASKIPYLRAIERQFSEFLRCYALISEPGQSGTFGVDLQIGVKGGKPRVEQPRSGLGGDDFKQCVVRAFENVEFEPQTKPTVISYSLRFSLDDS